MSEATITRLCREMEQALHNLDRTTKREYQVARDTLDSLVRTETPFINFLRTDNYDPVKAAHRLALYWKCRKEFFGERWLLPMTQTGTGALAARDIALLRTGYLHFLPVPNSAPIVFADISKAHDMLAQSAANNQNSEDCIETASNRCVMYLGTVAVNELGQTEGVTIAQVVHLENQMPPSRFRPKLWDMIRTALPMKIARVIVVQGYQEGKEALLEFLRLKLAGYASVNAQMPVEQVYGDSVGQTISRLERGGINRNNLPICIGGNLNYDAALADWTRMRLSVEDLMRAAPPTINVVPENGRMVAKSGPRHYTRKRKCETEIDIPNGEKDRNAMYSRRSYHRRKLVLVTLEEEVRVWEERNAAARAQGQWLEQLLAQARSIVYQIHGNMGDDMQMMAANTSALLPYFQ
mmetsp:Transcript_5463/g.10898  ORF Transcript_5463/g.10898 Transcript_5463/m.10898 type:complete len:409 (-) Transcript_5463:404-1630(-)